MKILFLNVYYDSFLRDHYKKNKIENLSYMEQWESIQGTMHGDSDFYSHGMSAQGWQTHDIITNCEPLQKRWAKENGHAGDSPIWIEQIRQYKPDVVYFQGIWMNSAEVYSLIKDHCKLIAGQVGSLLTSYAADRYSVVFTSIVPYVDRFREAGVKAHYVPLAFEPRVLERMGPQERTRPFTFVGGLTSGHGRRKKVVLALKDSCKLELFVGNKWGIGMFKTLAQSYMTMNCNIDTEPDYIGNMRIYEATGCGALLLTSDGINMPDIFEDDEVLKYNTIEEAVDLASYYLEHREEGAEIAARGQKRTLAEHTYEKRMAIVAEVLEGML